MDDNQTQRSDAGSPEAATVNIDASPSGAAGQGSERGERFRDAAIEAELATGEREPTRQKAWRNSVIRLARIGLGLGVVVLGIILMPLPGPGMLVIAVGLAILARDVAWADRLLRKVRERLPSDAEGKLPRSTVITMILLALAGIALSIWLTVGDINPIEVALFWRD